MSWLTNWIYRKKITLTGQAGAGTDYQVLLNVGESSGSIGDDFHLEGNSIDFPTDKDDGGDLRFTSDDGITLLDFWVESISGTYPDRTAKIWVEVADNLNSNVYIYCYYKGASGTSNYSDGEDTFPFFDDFPGSSLDTDKWTETGTVSVSSSEVNLDNNDDILAKFAYGNGYAYRNKSKADEQDSYFVFAYKDHIDNAGLYNEDDTPDDFDRFVFASDATAGAPDIVVNDNWYDFRNTYYIYEIQRISASKIKYSQEDNTNTYINPTYIPAGNLAHRHVVWDNSQESTLTVDWSLVRKCIDTEPSFNSVDSEEIELEVELSDTFQISDAITFPNLKEVDDTLILSDSIELTLFPLREESDDTFKISDSIEVGVEVFPDINNEFRMSALVLEDVNNKINTVIESISDCVNIFSSVNGVVADVNNDIRTLGEGIYNINNDIRMLASWQVPGDAGFESFGKEYVKVYISSVEQTDVTVDSISITKVVNGAHTASFELGRPYDDSKPTIESMVEIKYRDWLLYKGYITEITPSSSPESIIINCHNKYWKQNRDKKYFFVGHKPRDNQEKYYNKIITALSSEFSWSPGIGYFVPQTMSLFGSGESDALTALITNSGNYGWYYDINENKQLWIAGQGDIIDLERQEIGKNLGLFQVLIHQFKDSIVNIVNKLRVQMGDKVIRRFNDTGGTKDYPAYMYENVQAPTNPDWNSQYERLAKDGSDGYGWDYHPTDQNDNYKDVFTRYSLPFLDPELGSWTDRFPPQVEVLIPFSLWWEASVEEGVLKEGFTIDYENQKLIFNEPVYLFEKNQYGEAINIRAPHIILRMWKKKYYSNTEDENDDPESDISNPLMFFTDKVGTYSETIIDLLQLTNLSIQVGGRYTDLDGNKVVVPSWDDTAFAEDLAYWQLSNTAYQKVQGNIEVTLDSVCTYDINLNNRIMIDGVIENPLNIMSMSYDIGSFRVNIQLESMEYYRRDVSLQSHGE